MIQIIISALLGGFMVNLMPCILPVLPIKLRILQQIAKEGGSLKTHCAVVTLGSIVSFTVIGGFVALAKSLGMLAFWGGHMTSPWVLLTIAAVLTPFAASCFGFWTIRVPYIKNTGTGHLKSFVDGVLTVVIGAPCCGPILAGALAVTFMLPSWQMVLAFAVMGIGISLPMLIFALFPKIINVIPSGGKIGLVVERVLGVILTIMIVNYVISALGMIL